MKGPGGLGWRQYHLRTHEDPMKQGVSPWTFKCADDQGTRMFQFFSAWHRPCEIEGGGEWSFHHTSKMGIQVFFLNVRKKERCMSSASKLLAWVTSDTIKTTVDFTWNYLQKPSILTQLPNFIFGIACKNLHTFLIFFSKIHVFDII